ncbi:hypothetical protein FHX34_1011648 [Actinoplanes teichomyceticus]|uniref:Uncharacterized protein n=1 Tax=Actinoplanes teichomyceticus TaxID=1867 RepID=A0A561WS17_ACTTI|nr:hypothetical protein FHX34_1011648 [Actinoplanes teichomyceticus]
MPVAETGAVAGAAETGAVPVAGAAGTGAVPVAETGAVAGAAETGAVPVAGAAETGAVPVAGAAGTGVDAETAPGFGAVAAHSGPGAGGGGGMKPPVRSAGGWAGDGVELAPSLVACCSSMGPPDRGAADGFRTSVADLNRATSVGVNAPCIDPTNPTTNRPKGR